MRAHVNDAVSPPSISLRALDPSCMPLHLSYTVQLTLTRLHRVHRTGLSLRYARRLSTAFSHDLKTPWALIENSVMNVL